MLILQASKFYPFLQAGNIKEPLDYHYPYGGTEAMMLSIEKILELHGHKSVFFSMKHPENLYCKDSDYFMPYVNLNNSPGIINKLKAAGRLLYSFEARRRISRLLEDYSIDIAHLHSICHHISPSILHELKTRKIPMVMTFHSYKVVCASYHLEIKGRPCEACSGGRFYMIVKNKCVKNSLFKSALCASEMYLHHNILDIYGNIDIFIAPSLFLKNKILEMGFKKDIVYLPNFIDVKKFEELDIEREEGKADKKKCIVYFGRLAPVKGLWTMLDAVKMMANDKNKNNVEVKIIGEGPIGEELRKKVKSEGLDRVHFLGYMKGNDLYREIIKSSAVVLPSECYENSPISVLEAFALGIPVIGSRIGGIPEFVKDNETGLTFDPGSQQDLYSKMKILLDNPEKAAEMGRKARAFVEKELTAEKYYEKLMEIYKQAISMNGR